MKKFSIILLLMMPFFNINAQNFYIDFTTTFALKYYSDNLSDKQDETIQQQNKLQKAQAWVASQMAVANSIQNQVLKGLNEVSGTLKNGQQVLDIYRDVSKSYEYASAVLNLTKNHPQFSVFGVKSSQKVYETALKLATETSELLQPGALNLATSGDRYKLLFSISENVKMLKMWIFGVKMYIENALYVGFWKSLNPFQGYINTDKDIVENILHTYRNRF